MLEDIIKQKKISKYRLSKVSGIPYTTLTDILSGKTDIKKCSAETIYRLSKALEVSMEDILVPYIEKCRNFELFKSSVCHDLKKLGDVDFIIQTLEKDEIQKYYYIECYPESFYLLGMLDYVSRLNNVPLCNKYDELRKKSLPEPIFPAGIVAISEASGKEDAKKEAIITAIPEFKRFNIIENEVRNVVCRKKYY